LPDLKKIKENQQAHKLSSGWARPIRFKYKLKKNNFFVDAALASGIYWDHIKENKI